MDGAECQFLNLQQSREKDRLREDRVHNGTCKKEEKRKSKKQKKRKSKKQKIVLDKWAAALYNNVRPPERMPRMKLEG